MRYVDGYVLTIAKKKLSTYKKMAKDAGKVWMKCGALQYVETMGDDMTSAKKWGGLTFPEMTKSKTSEVIVFAFVVYKSRKHRDQVNAKVHKTFEKKYGGDCSNQPMPFDMKRMAYGGFETIVDL